MVWPCGHSRIVFTNFSAKSGPPSKISGLNNILSDKPIIAEPGTACTETYLVAGHFLDKETAGNYAKYLRTRFVRFLVSLRKATQHATRDVYSFVPDLPLDKEWSDAKLYKRYSLTQDEIAFIESQVAEHSDDLDEGNDSNDD